jgi:O-methyltransferase
MDVLRNFRKIIPKNIGIWIRKQIEHGITFDGWGMKTVHELPWNGGIRNEFFILVSQDIKKHFDFSGDDGVNLSVVDGLLCHWIVSYCVRHAVEFTGKDLELVECGVCNGLTAFFALRELQGLGSCDRMHLYDAWLPMCKDSLLESEKESVGNYSNITIERVKKNLSEFDNIIYHPGYIPDSLHSEPPSPEKISYLSIDLNSAGATIAALEFFFPRVLKGGVILFDDYGGIDHSPTKKSVDKFFADKYGILMPLPTGQAIYYR